MVKSYHYMLYKNYNELSVALKLGNLGIWGGRELSGISRPLIPRIQISESRDSKGCVKFWRGGA